MYICAGMFWVAHNEFERKFELLMVVFFSNFQQRLCITVSGDIKSKEYVCLYSLLNKGSNSYKVAKLCFTRTKNVPCIEYYNPHKQKIKCELEI